MAYQSIGLDALGMQDVLRKFFQDNGIQNPYRYDNTVPSGTNGPQGEQFTPEALALLQRLGISGAQIDEGGGYGDNMGGYQLTGDSGVVNQGTFDKGMSFGDTLKDMGKTGAGLAAMYFGGPLLGEALGGGGSLLGGGGLGADALGLDGLYMGSGAAANGIAGGVTSGIGGTGLLGGGMGGDALGLDGLYSASGAAANKVASGGSLLGGASSLLKDIAPLAGAVIGAASSGDQTQTTNRDPWGPAQPWLKANIDSAQALQKKYQDNPFSDGQKTAYGNIANIINGANQAAPAFWNGMSANSTGANNYDRNNPRRSLIGTNASMPGYSMGLLNPFGG